MTPKQIQEILEKISRVKIAVYGDFCLDAYWQMDQDGSEVSVETGLKAEAVASHKYSPGGAGNIVVNLAALKPDTIKVIGVVGNDIYGRELSAQLNKLGARVSSLIIQEDDFDTYTYTKKYFGEKEDPRIDFGLKNRRSEKTDEAILHSIEEALESYDALIFNQQVTGSITNPDFIDRANELFDKYKAKIVVLDSRHFNSKFRNVYRKANEIETAALLGLDVNTQDYISFSEIRKHASQVYEREQKPIFVTCGARGIISIDASGISEIPGVRLLKKLDTVGAGDTTISALTLCLAAGISPPEAAAFANLAAAVTVQKLFTTGAASGEEIIELSTDADYNHQPELAEDLSLASYLPDSEIELCRQDVLLNLGKIKHAVFDHDGTISTLREGWEQVMEPVMIRAILGDNSDAVDQSLHQEIRMHVQKFIDRSTGIQTIVQMEGLVQMVDEYNLVPKEKILDKFGYKKIYNDELMKVVSLRMKKFETGELTVDDCTINGSVKLLRALKERGLRLYLASGTDIDDVIHEAELLGYADLFSGGIHGSVGDINKYSKKKVIHKIIAEHQLTGNELAVFGDGPVEIKECIKSNGIAIGIASDEVRGSGLNREKRTRLIKSGAQILVPDFSQSDKLLDLLFKLR